MVNIIARYEDHLIHVKNASANTVSSYMRDLRQYASYLETRGTAVQTRELLALPDPPTCIFYPDDTSLIGGRNVIIESGLKIPDDISIVGYDGIQMSQLLHPKITTISQNMDEIGREAARRLIGTIENPKTTLIEQVVIEGTLFKGQSVGEIVSD